MRLGSDLTVLSACNTAMGRTVNADGLVGLSYALLVAGNANTIATLWPVTDRDTTYFVDRLFANIQAGMPHGKALAETKRAFMRHPIQKLRDPRYWGAFVLFGA
ncbi:MAG: CHAT domain-containing protein [Aeromicrobium sp.]|nr:CHAT domain-containing protein [Burkholderiales bacterium]